MGKNHTQKTLLFLKRLFYDSSAVIIIFIIVIAGIGGYLVYFKETDKPATETAGCVKDNSVDDSKNHKNSSINSAAITDAQKQNKENFRPAPKKNQVVLTLGWDVDPEDENHEPDLENLSEKFEEDALRYTDAEKIRVESKGIDKPGYVAFMCSPDGFRRGVNQVMKEIAEIYLETFPDAPRVCVSLIIGGGVKGQKTFLRNNMP